MITVAGGLVDRDSSTRLFMALISGAGPISAALIATRKPRIAAWICLSVALILAWIALPWDNLFSRNGAIFLALSAPGFFWVLAAWRRWPVLLSAWPFTRQPWLRLFVGCGLGVILFATSAFGSLFMPWWRPIGDCNGLPLLDGNGHPRFTDFTAKILLTGPETWRGYSLWALARVERRFSGEPWLGSDLVILRGGFRRKDNGRRYFMEGYRSSGFARVLPIITPTQCSHTALLDRAGVDVRILMDGPPKSGARLIGAVGGCSLYDPRPGVSIRVDGPATSFDLVTDKQGIYDAKDLPSGIYTIHEPGGTISTVQLSEGKIERRDLCEK